MRDNRVKKGKGQVKEHVQRTHGQGQWGRDCLWEQGLDRAGERNRETTGATVTEQQQKKDILNSCCRHPEFSYVTLKRVDFCLRRILTCVD